MTAGKWNNLGIFLVEGGGQGPAENFSDIKFTGCPLPPQESDHESPKSLFPPEEYLNRPS